ncbi:MAG: chromate transporter [Candidatus Cloacimonadaceae bacterium]
MKVRDYFGLFFSFFKIGLFTIGGGYAMLPLIQREVVEKRHWLDQETFLDGLSAAQACPGPVAVNISIYVGYQIGGWIGMLLTVLGTVLPSFLIILAIAASFSRWSEIPVVQNAFHGLRPAVTALIAVAVIQISRQAKIKWFSYWLPLAALLLIVFFNVSPLWLILFTFLLGGVKYFWKKDKKEEKDN